MNVTKDFNGRVNTKHHRLILHNANTLVCKCQDVLTAERKVALAIIHRGPLSRAQQVREEQVM